MRNEGYYGTLITISVEPMSKMCVAIGVSKVMGSALPTLNAAHDAEGFHGWAQNHDFQSTLLTDHKQGVTLQMIKDGVNAAITKGATQLVIYFGGHRILKAPDTEIWLLSDVMSDSQQAVNLAGSVALARNGKIPNVIFISDACRSVTTNQTLFRINGGEIFPPDFIPRRSAEIDRLYATLPGSSAADFAVLFCKSCERPMIATYSAKRGRRYRYYVCQAARQNGWKSCPTKSVSATVIEESVVAELRKQLNDEKARIALNVPDPDWREFLDDDSTGLVQVLVRQIRYEGSTGTVSVELRMLEDILAEVQA